MFATSDNMPVSKIEGQKWKDYLETRLALKCLISTSKYLKEKGYVEFLLKSRKNIFHIFPLAKQEFRDKGPFK